MAKHIRYITVDGDKKIVYSPKTGSNPKHFAHNCGCEVSIQYITTDTTTQGDWSDSYGFHGYRFINGGTDSTNTTTQSEWYKNANISVTPADFDATYCWDSVTTDVRALEKFRSASGDNRAAGCWFDATDFTVRVTIKDPACEKRLVAFYFLDWDDYGGGRDITIEVRKYGETTKALSDVSLTNFGDGKYVVYKMYGDYVFTIKNNNGSSNAVLSGVFIGDDGTNDKCVTPDVYNTGTHPTLRTSFFGDGASYPAGVYTIRYVYGAMKYFGAGQYQMNITNELGFYRFVVRYNNDTAQTDGPGSDTEYATQALLEAGEGGASVAINHTGGKIGVALYDYDASNTNWYSDNVIGNPNPTFCLEAGGTPP